MRLLHTGDRHANANIKKYIKSLDQVKNYVATESNRIDCTLDGGDLFDSRVYLQPESNYILKSFAEQSEYNPVFTVYGTPSHDFKGSLDLLPALSRRYPIKVIDTIDNRFYHFNGKNTAEVFRETNASLYPPVPYAGFYLFGVPWLMRSRILSDDELKLPIKTQEELFKLYFDAWIKTHRAFKLMCGLPVIMVAHLQLKGAVFSKGQDVSSENHEPEWFYDICDYGALNHVHKACNFRHLYYSGSTFNKSWGEIEDKYFNIITIEGNKIVEVEQVKYDTPVLMKADLNSVEEYQKFKDDFIHDRLDTSIKDKKVELWINLTVKNKEALGQKNELTFWQSLRNLEYIRFDVAELKIESSARLNYSNTGKSSLLAKAEAWVESKNLKLSDYQKNKLIELENGQLTV